MRIQTRDGRYHAPPEGLPRLLPVRRSETNFTVIARRWGWDYRDLYRSRRDALADRERARRQYEQELGPSYAVGTYGRVTDRVYVDGRAVGRVVGGVKLR